jgi:hypothetical protein
MSRNIRMVRAVTLIIVIFAVTFCALGANKKSIDSCSDCAAGAQEASTAVWAGCMMVNDNNPYCSKLADCAYSTYWADHCSPCDPGTGAKVVCTASQ